MDRPSELDARVEERTRLAREIHDTLLQTIHASSMIVYAAQEEPGTPPKTIAALDTLARWLSRATEEARSSLEALRSSTTLTNELGEAFKIAGMEGVHDRPIQFDFSRKGTAKELHPIVGDEVHRIGCETIRNACIHSGGSRIEVELTYDKDLSLRGRDNGKGIDPRIAEKGQVGHFGLKGMRERATRIGAKLNMVTSPDTGTLIELIVPGRLILRNPRPPWRSFLTRRA